MATNHICHRTFAVLLALCCWGLHVTADPIPQTAPPSTFHFQPKEGTCRIHQYRNIISNLPEKKRRQIRSEVWLIELQVQRQGSEYVFVESTKSLNQIIDGTPRPNPANALLLSTSTTNIIAHDGSFVRSLKRSDYLSQYQKIFSSDAWGSVDQTLKERPLDEVARIDWESNIGMLADRQFTFGDIWRYKLQDAVDHAPPAFPNMHFVKIFSGTVTNLSQAFTNARPTPVLEILTFSCTDGDLLRRFPLEKARDMERSPAKEFVDFDAVDHHVEKLCRRQLIDPATMTLYLQQDVVQVIDFGDQGKLVQTELSTRRYNYDMSAPEPLNARERQTITDLAATHKAALLDKDFEKILSLLDPEILKAFGGKQKVLEAVTADQSKNGAAGLTYESIDFELADPIYIGSDFRVTFVRTDTTVRLNNLRTRQKSFLIAYSPLRGQAWYMLDGSKFTPEQFRTLFRGVPDSLELPKVEREDPAASVNTAAVTLQIGRVTLNLPHGWEKFDQPKTFFVQERARNDALQIAVSAGRFEMELPLEQYVALGLLGVASEPGKLLEKIATMLNIPVDEVRRTLETTVGREYMQQLQQQLRSTKFELVNAKRIRIQNSPAFETLLRTTVLETGQILYSRQFTLAGAGPREMVSITYASPSEAILNDRNLLDAIQVR